MFQIDGLTFDGAPTTKAVGSYGFMKMGTDGFSRRTTNKKRIIVLLKHPHLNTNSFSSYF